MTIMRAVRRRESFSRRVIRGQWNVPGRWAAPGLCIGLLLAGCQSTDRLEEFNSAEAPASRARMLEARGDFNAAMVEFEHAARLARDDGAQARYLLSAGECALRAGDTSRAWLNLSRSLSETEELAFSDPFRQTGLLRANAGLGDLDLQAGRHANARVHYDNALEVARHDARDSILYRLMVLAESEGDATRANQYRDRIVQWNSPAIAELRRVLPTTRQGPRDKPWLRSSPAPVAGSIPMFRTRSDWSARPHGSNYDPMGRPYRITVHHTGDSYTSTSQNEASDTIQRIQRHHMNNNGWADIGYHYLIDPAGRIWQGRKVNQQGAHAGNPSLNRGNVGIALLGNFSAHSVPTAQSQALESLLVNLMTRYRIPVHEVHSHQHIRPDPTECPGRALSRQLPGILQKVNARVLRAQAGAPPRGGSDHGH